MTAILKKNFFLIVLAAVLMTAPPSHAAPPAGGILEHVCADAQVLVYIPDINDFKNYSKWSPIYNYVAREDYGGVYLTMRGRQLLEKLESAVKMPVTELFSLFKNEVVIWAEINEFSMNGLNIAIMIAPSNVEKWLSIFDSLLLKNKEIASCEKIDAGACAYSVAVSMPNFISPELKNKIEFK